MVRYGQFKKSSNGSPIKTPLNCDFDREKRKINRSFCMNRVVSLFSITYPKCGESKINVYTASLGTFQAFL
jgi:hypothetical protein